MGGVWASNFGGAAPGFEPPTSCMRVRSRSHYATGAAPKINFISNNLFLRQSNPLRPRQPQQQRPLEVLILERSKALQAENTTLRVDRDRAASELSEARAELGERAAEAERQRELVKELEDHVEKLQEMSNRWETKAMLFPFPLV